MLCPILIILFTLFGCGKKAKDRIRIVMIEGIKHVQNPENPIKGIVHLDVEKVFEINPYQYEEVSLKFVRFIRGADGTVILFDGNSSNVEAHIVSSDREYLGRFLRLGQGPGEFPQFSGLRFYLKSDEIIVSGGRKLAIFDKSGNFIAENKMEFSLDIFLDIDRYFIYETRGQLEDRHEKIILKERIGEESSDFKDTLFFEAKNVGMIYTATVAFADSWATPRIAYSLDHKEQRFYVALNTEYKNFVKNLKGKILHVIEKKHGDIWFKCIIPSHKDKDESAHICADTMSPHYGRWHCFGCQKGGSIFNFIMYYFLFSLII